MNKLGIKVYFNELYINGVYYGVNGIRHVKYQYQGHKNRYIKIRYISSNVFGIKLRIYE